MSLQRWINPFAVFEQDEEVFPMTSSTTNLSVYEDNKCIHVEAALPGLQPKECEVSFDKGILTIRGNKEEQEENKNRKYFRKASQSFMYRIQVPGDIDETQEPVANLKEGVMQVSFHKKQEKKPRKIHIQNA